jgi:hypothetical protein
LWISKHHRTVELKGVSIEETKKDKKPKQSSSKKESETHKNQKSAWL